MTDQELMEQEEIEKKQEECDHIPIVTIKNGYGEGECRLCGKLLK